MIVEQPATRWSLSSLRPTTIRLRSFSFPTSASNHPYTGGVKIQSSHFSVESSEDDSNDHLGAWKFKGVVRSRPPEGVPKLLQTCGLRQIQRQFDGQSVAVQIRNSIGQRSSFTFQH